jgi:hypothetical protein
MGLSLRLLVLDQTDRIYRLDTTRFVRMRDSPKKHPLPQFAGQRVRSAEVVVQLVDRKPARIVRATFSILTFDGAGRLKAEVFGRQQFARFASAAAHSGFGVDSDEQPGVRVPPFPPYISRFFSVLRDNGTPLLANRLPNRIASGCPALVTPNPAGAVPTLHEVATVASRTSRCL